MFLVFKEKKTNNKSNIGLHENDLLHPHHEWISSSGLNIYIMINISYVKSNFIKQLRNVSVANSGHLQTDSWIIQLSKVTWFEICAPCLPFLFRWVTSEWRILCLCWNFLDQSWVELSLGMLKIAKCSKQLVAYIFLLVVGSCWEV